MLLPIIISFLAIAGTIVFFLCFKPFQVREKQEKRIAAAEQGMTATQFTMHNLKSTAYLMMFGMLFWGAVLVLFVFLSPDTMDRLLLFVVAPVIFYRIMQGVYYALWKLEVTGSTMYLRTLFRRREFSFYDVRSVRVQTHKYYGLLDTGNVKRLVVRFETGQRLRIDAHIVGYRLFVERLKQRNVPGIEKLEAIEAKHGPPQDTQERLREQKRQLRKFGVSKTGIGLYIAQILLIILAAVPVIAMFFFDGWFFAGADTASELLESYLLWFQVGIGGIAFWFLLTIIGNLLIIRRARRSGNGIGGYIVVGVVTVLTLALIASGALLFDEDGLLAGIQEVQGDLAAIEQEALLVTRVSTNVNTAHERPWRLLGTETPTVYRLTFSGEPGFLHFPMAVEPGVLRERFRGAEYQFFGYEADIRVLEIRYTPNLHIVVEVTPVVTITLEQAPQLLGTWDWDTDANFRYVFYADGTGSRGFTGDVNPFLWQTQGADHLQIVIDGMLEDWTFTIEDGILTIENWLVPEMIFSYIAR